MSDKNIRAWGGVILCGGQARRMGGRDKASIPLGGRSLLDIAVSNLSRDLDKLALCPGQVDVPALSLAKLDDRKVEGCPIGPAGALLAALDWAESENLAGILTVPVDTPFLPRRFCKRLVGADKPAYVHHNGRDHWLHAAWPIEVALRIKAAILNDSNYALHRIHAAIGSRPVEFANAAKGAFHNINTPEDLAEAERRFAK